MNHTPFRTVVAIRSSWGPNCCFEPQSPKYILTEPRRRVSLGGSATSPPERGKLICLLAGRRAKLHANFVAEGWEDCRQKLVEADPSLVVFQAVAGPAKDMRAGENLHFEPQSGGQPSPHSRMEGSDVLPKLAFAGPQFTVVSPLVVRRRGPRQYRRAYQQNSARLDNPDRFAECVFRVSQVLKDM